MINIDQAVTAALIAQQIPSSAIKPAGEVIPDFYGVAVMMPDGTARIVYFDDSEDLGDHSWVVEDWNLAAWEASSTFRRSMDEAVQDVTLDYLRLAAAT